MHCPNAVVLAYSAWLYLTSKSPHHQSLSALSFRRMPRALVQVFTFIRCFVSLVQFIYSAAPTTAEREEEDEVKSTTLRSEPSTKNSRPARRHLPTALAGAAEMFQGRHPTSDDPSQAADQHR